MALVSNLHFGLAAYAPGTFTVGQRCATGGNAYQCTTGGASTTAPTGTGSAISGGGGTVFKWLSSVDYTTFQAWANALPSTFTQPAQLLVWNDGPITSTPGVAFLTLSGHTTTPSNNITIQPAPGEGFPVGALAYNSSAGASILLPATSATGINYFSLLDDNTTVQGLQFKDPLSTSGSTILQISQNATLQNCIVDGYSQAGGAYMINPSQTGATGAVFRLLNNLVIDRAPNGTAQTSTVDSNYSGVIANNTFVALNAPANLGCVTDTSVASGIIINQTNNIMLGYPTAALITQSQNTGTTINVKYGLLSASSLTNVQVVAGAGNIYSAPTTGQFINSATDFRLLATSQAATSGFTDTADIPSGTDIFGLPRFAPWSMGANEYQTPSSVGSGGGQAAGLGVSSGPRSIGSGGGRASGLGASLGGSTGSGGGQASGLGRSTANFSVGTGGGQASGVGYSAFSAVSGTITISNPGTQIVGTAFPVVGTFTLIPELQVADDVNVTFSPIPASGISALGSSTFEFIHPGLPATGTYNLLVEDLSTDASAATSYAVSATPPPPPPPPPTSPSNGPIGSSLTALSKIIPAYVYQEYSDDQNIQAFFQAYNILAQQYLDYMNTLNLPIYTGLSGALLDWVALGLYGVKRPVLAAVQHGAIIGPFNTYQLNEIPINANLGTSTSSVFPVTDDIFKRIITWSFYRGDGTVFSATWLKRRVMRFLYGVNGTDYIGPTTQVSVQYAGTSTVTVKLSAGAVPLTMAPVLQAAVISGVLPLPFQYSFNILV